MYLLFFYWEFTVFDFCWLGIHTGSHLGEYGQSSSGKRGTFAHVPNTSDAGLWANTPLAFMANDFTFYNAQQVLVLLEDVSQAWVGQRQWTSTSNSYLTRAGPTLQCENCVGCQVITSTLWRVHNQSCVRSFSCNCHLITLSGHFVTYPVVATISLLAPKWWSSCDGHVSTLIWTQCIIWGSISHGGVSFLASYSLCGTA